MSISEVAVVGKRPIFSVLHNPSSLCFKFRPTRDSISVENILIDKEPKRKYYFFGIRLSSEQVEKIHKDHLNKPINSSNIEQVKLNRKSKITYQIAFLSAAWFLSMTNIEHEYTSEELHNYIEDINNINRWKKMLKKLDLEYLECETYKIYA